MKKNILPNVIRCYNLIFLKVLRFKITEVGVLLSVSAMFCFVVIKFLMKFVLVANSYGKSESLAKPTAD